VEVPLSVAGLFAGIGGLELGLAAAGHHTEFLCEIDPAAQAVLGRRFGLPVAPDVRRLRALPKVDLLAAGFPCQDLSQAGGKAGIEGPKSGLVGQVFRLCDRRRPPWVLLENVSYMLRLDAGRAMHRLVDGFEELGYRWAYRVVDARSFGMPQRRQRVLFLASLVGEPESVLFADDAEDPSAEHDRVGPVDRRYAYGFYWTEGLRGLGWTRDAVPTVKGGSTLGIPSPPAVWIPTTGFVGTPTLHDLERLQGFDAGWTAPADDVPVRPKNPRLRLVGNAVCVPMAAWVGRRLRSPGSPVAEPSSLPERAWPIAAAGVAGRRYHYDLTKRTHPARDLGLAEFLTEALVPLSSRATQGFLNRARVAKINFADGFLDALQRHREAYAQAS
jgi:DNA (cytosine-5)-methyltransferase 1